MQESIQTELGTLIVYKGGAINDKQGFLVPLLSVSPENDYRAISRVDYPADILVSRGYPEVDEAYNDGELFMLSHHYKDEEKTESLGAPRYWAKGDSVCSLPSNTLLPVFEYPLPPKETGALPDGVLPPRGIFFQKDADKIYGPLTSSQTDDGHVILEPVSHPSLSFGKDYLGVFEPKTISGSLMRVEIDKTSYLFVTSIKALMGQQTEALDYMSDDRLIKYFNQKGVGPNLKVLAKKEADKLQQAITKFERTHRSTRSERFERLKLLVDRYLDEADIGHDLIKSHLSSSNGTKFLNEYVERNHSELLSRHLEDVKKKAEAQEEALQRKLEELKKQISSREEDLVKAQEKVTGEREKAKLEIERIQEETKEVARQKLEEQQEELARHVAAEQESLVEIKSRIEEATQRLQIADDLDALRREQIFYERNNDKLKAAAQKFEDVIKNPEELASKMGEMEVISRVLKGGSAAIDSTAPDFIPVDYTSNTPSTGAELVDMVCSHFDEDGGRPFSEEEMTNLLVSLTQSFITVLAGPPGVGKTSSVIRLAQALHLGETCGRKNFLYIPVGRGWVSGRDILGFYNSLKGVYQRSRTGLYDFLNRESLTDAQAPQIVLLDEANLSPMEHYWSDFLGMCDLEGRLRPLDTGIPSPEDRYLNIGSHVRFVATINNDNTTERLSPRLIDRVPVISLEDDGKIYNSDSSGLKLDGAIDSSLLGQFFTTEDAELSRADDAFLNRIINTLNDRDSELGQTVPISVRKQMAITNYCAVAGEIMGSDTAMDFAISQHVLPHIEGYGTKFRNRIAKLLPLLSKSHPRSTRHVERILAGGNDFTGTYSFF